jgi:hypothetical protein
VLARELTEPIPYSPDGDEGDGCTTDLQERLMRRLSPLKKDKKTHICRLLHTWSVSLHNGIFDGPDQSSLRTFLDARRATLGEGEL